MLQKTAHARTHTWARATIFDAQRNHNGLSPTRTMKQVLHACPQLNASTTPTNLTHTTQSCTSFYMQAVKETKLSNQHLLRPAPSARVQRARTQYSFQFVKRKSSRVRTELTQPNSARRIREGGRERGAVHTASPSQNSLTFFQKLETMPNFELSPEHRILKDPNDFLVFI